MNPFDRLAPYIKEFIWQQRWSELRQMQGEAIEAILDTPHHVLLAGATASGKTEAAFLPILTELEDKPSRSIGVLYLGPLKALINDQFQRLDALLEHAGVEVWPWHGDVGQGMKRRALKTHQGVLQTTPESLEGFFIYRKEHLATLFADLRYVVIDEVHAFMASDRGRQVLCQLARLERLVGCHPRRVGLSATLGDYGLAEAWLQGGTATLVTTIADHGQGRRIKLGLNHYRIADSPEGRSEVDGARSSRRRGHTAVADGGPDDETRQFIGELAHLADGRKSLVFVKSRAQAEEVGAGLKELAERQRRKDIYFVHHGSVSKDYRLDAEEAMRAENRPACTVATVTLELGIDLGQLERVMQVGPSPSVSSFVQRLGRTGRRGEPGEMFFFALEAPPDPSEHPIERLPWDLLLSIAQVQLYLEERWVEPGRPPKLPYSLLYHQTMSTLLQFGEMEPAALAREVLALPPFGSVSRENFKVLLLHLLEIDHLQWTEERHLLIGLAGEKVVNDWRFLATFQDQAEYQVVCEGDHIGSIGDAPPLGTVIRLAGRTWRVDAVEERQRTVLVKAVKGKAQTHWIGGGGEIHDRVVQRLRQVLEEDVDYPYVLPKARRRLAEARDLARSSAILSKPIQRLGEGHSLLTAWVGTQALGGLQVMLGTRLGWSNVAVGRFPFFLKIKLEPSDLIAEISQPVSADDIRQALMVDIVPRAGKFDRFVPGELLVEAYVEDGIDLVRASELMAGVQAWARA